MSFDANSQLVPIVLRAAAEVLKLRDTPLKLLDQLIALR
jgi:hypothetical protein